MENRNGYFIRYTLFLVLLLLLYRSNLCHSAQESHGRCLLDKISTMAGISGAGIPFIDNRMTPLISRWNIVVIVVALYGSSVFTKFLDSEYK